MFELLKKFFSDQAFFEASTSRFAALLRGALGAFALAVTTGQINLGEFLGPYAYWAAPIGVFLALYMRSNPSLVEQAKKATPEELAQLRELLK